jgi:hypothetical protein
MWWVANAKPWPFYPPLYRRLRGPQGRSGRVQKTSPQPGFDPRTVQSLASRYSDWATPVHKTYSPSQTVSCTWKKILCSLHHWHKIISCSYWYVNLRMFKHFVSRKTRYPLYRRLRGSQGRSGRVQKISLPPGFGPRTVQPVTSRYSDWVIPVHKTHTAHHKLSLVLGKRYFVLYITGIKL